MDSVSCWVAIANQSNEKKKHNNKQASLRLIWQTTDRRWVIFGWSVGLWRVVGIWITILFADSCRHKCDLNAFVVISNKVYWNRTALQGQRNEAYMPGTTAPVLECTFTIALALAIIIQTHRFDIYIYMLLFVLEYLCVWICIECISELIYAYHIH